MTRNYFVALGGGDEIGASCYLLSLGKSRLLFDVGMRLRAERAFPDFGRLGELVGGPNEISAVLVTHAHLDHCGAATRLHYEAPHVPKYATPGTLALMQVMLEDALRVSQAHRSEDWHVVEATRDVLDDMLTFFTPVSFLDTFQVASTGAVVTPLQAGHILGAASYLVEEEGLRILVTGDLSLHAQRTIAGFDQVSLPEKVDVLVIESTYAYQPDYLAQTVEEQYYALAETLRAIIQKEGRALIPAFALGRAQEIMCLLHDCFEQRLLEPFPVRVDGLVKAVTEVYNGQRGYLQGRLRDKKGHAFYSEWVQPMPEGFYPTPSAVGRLEPMCIISSSGMLLDGTRSSRYAEALLGNPQDAVLFSGYLDAESPGRRLLDWGGSGSRFQLNQHSIEVHARLARYHLSAHAPSSDLQHLIVRLHPKVVILVHGSFQYTGEPSFTGFLMRLEQEGIHVHHSANGVPIYF